MGGSPPVFSIFQLPYAIDIFCIIPWQKQLFNRQFFGYLMDFWLFWPKFLKRTHFRAESRPIWNWNPPGGYGKEGQGAAVFLMARDIKNPSSFRKRGKCYSHFVLANWISSVRRSTWWCGPSERCSCSRCRTRTQPVDRPQSGLSTDFSPLLRGTMLMSFFTQFTLPESKQFTGLHS